MNKKKRVQTTLGEKGRKYKSWNGKKSANINVENNFSE